MHLKSLLAQHAAPSMLKQLALQDAIGERGWRVDLEQGSIWFGDSGPHAVQLLGTEGFGDQTWLWAWANRASDLPPAVIEASARLRALGVEQGVAELVTPRMPLSQVDGQTLAVVASGLLQAGSTYRGPYDGGAAFFLLPEFPRAAEVDGSPARIVRALTLAISTWELDHRAVVAGLGADLGLPVHDRPGGLTLSTPGGDVQLDLDAAGRIARMSATVRQG